MALLKKSNLKHQVQGLLRAVTCLKCHPSLITISLTASEEIWPALVETDKRFFYHLKFFSLKGLLQSKFFHDLFTRYIFGFDLVNVPFDVVTSTVSVSSEIVMMHPFKGEIKHCSYSLIIGDMTEYQVLLPRLS